MIGRDGWRPFLDAETIADLYASTERLATRSATLKRAKIRGQSPNRVVADLLTARCPARPRLLEAGCGRGGLSEALMVTLDPTRLLAVDSSDAMLVATRERVASSRLDTLCADFHALPLPAAGFDGAAAAFCVYHSVNPAAVCAELGRCAKAEGVVVLATKSADSYQQLDALAANSGLDPGAAGRPSLYETFCTENMEQVAEAVLDVVETRTELNVFHFDAPVDALAYMATSPKYEVDWSRWQHCLSLLAASWPPRGLTVTSTVGYLAARPRES